MDKFYGYQKRIFRVFKSKGHDVISSMPLVPDDPTH